MKNRLYDKDTLDLESMVGIICNVLPEGYMVSLNMEKGSAWIELTKFNPNKKWFREKITLPDSTDKNLCEQLHDALDTSVVDIEEAEDIL